MNQLDLPIQANENGRIESSPGSPMDHDSNGEKHSPEATDSIAERRQRKLLDVSKYAPSKRGHFEAAYSGRSRKSGVNAMCFDCAGFQQEEVRKCPVVACPLWEYRPYK